MSLGQKIIHSSFLKVNDSSAAGIYFLCACMLVQNTGVLELPKHRNDNKHFIAYRKSAFRIWSLKMQILHSTVALWAWVCAGCVRVLARLLKVICSAEKPVSFLFTLHLFPYSGVVCNKVFAFRVFRKGSTYFSTNATVHILWENGYSSWSILEVLDFCYSL